MKTLIIYDNEGHILASRYGSTEPREPKGVPFLWVDIPSGKQIKIQGGIGVDTSVTPHRVLLENVPPSEFELLRIEMAKSNAELFEMMIMMGGNL